MSSFDSDPMHARAGSVPASEVGRKRKKKIALNTQYKDQHKKSAVERKSSVDSDEMADFGDEHGYKQEPHDSKAMKNTNNKAGIDP